MWWQVLLVISVRSLSVVCGQVSYSIPEEMAKGALIGNIAQDLGLGVERLKSGKARVYTGNSEEYIELKRERGVLLVKERIDRESLCGQTMPCALHFQMILENPMEFYTVTVEITDINDNPPAFERAEMKYEIPESALAGARFVLEKAVDDDVGVNGLNSYALKPSDNFALKTIVRGEGTKHVEMVLQKPLDREKREHISLILTAVDGDSELDRERASEYNITVTCSDEGVPSLSSSVTLTLQISDVNDNAPVFESSSYEAYIVENNTPGLSIFTVKARDADWNQNARVSYILEDSSVNGVPVSSYVSVSADSGVIHAVRSFDYEQIKDFQFRVKAQDGGSPPLSSNVTVKVLIQDQNDNPPQVLYPVQTGGSLVAEMVPRSADVGYLVTKVVAVDISDVNDNAPVFESSSYEAYIVENNTPGLSIFTVKARDADWNQNARVSYLLEDSSVNGVPVSSYVSVSADSGVIHAVRSFDYEQIKDFQFRVKAQDGGSPPLSSNVTVKVLIQDQNDNPPQVLYPVQTGGSLVAEMVPRSADVGYLIYRWRQSRVLYHSNLPVIPYYPPRYSDTLGTGTLQHVYNYEVCRTTDSRKSDCKFGRAGSQNVLIMEPSSTGTMQRMQSEKSILDEPDSPLELSFPFNLSASEPRTAHLVTTVLVVVDIVKYCLLTLGQVSYSIPEEMSKGSLVGNIAQDLGLEIKRLISGKAKIYTRNSDAYIELNRERGVLLVKQRIDREALCTETALYSELDRERSSEYNITVTCSDEGVPSLSSSVTLTLQISDVNDNAPVFESSSYEAYIVENNTPGLSIFTVKARDADWNQNARVSYILEDSSVNGVPVSSYVSVSADSGVIHAVRSFDYEQIKDFQFRVKAQDGGSPPLSSNVTVKVLIQDQNDNPPQVLYPVQTGGSLVAEMVPRSADVGYLVTKVVAVDVDSGQNAWLSYKLQKATDRALFEVGSQNGEIRTIRQVTDKDAVKQRLTVIVEDNGQPSRSATVVVNVAVADSFPEVLSEFTDFTHDKEYNDNLTFYLVLALAVVSFLFITCLVVIISVKIYRWRQSRVLYHSNLPVIPYYPPRYSDTLGTGTLQHVYNYEVCRTTDSRKSDCKFGRAGSQNVLIMEPSSTGTMQRMQSEKSILDEPDSPLEIILENPIELFRITVEITDINDNSPSFKREEKRFEISESAVTGVTLTLQISDVNDNAPVFESSSYEAYIVENNTPGLSIFTVKARDADWNQNARVSYILEDSSVNGVPVSSYVSVSADSGVIHAVRSFDYEQIKDFQFRVKAQDGGSPPLSSNVTVKVLIQDQNDNPPQVLYPVQTGGSLVAEMVPRSADVGYLVTKVNGEIRTIRQVTDKDAVKQRLTVIVEDNGQPSRSATVVVNVAVADSFPEVLSEFTDFTHDKEYNDNLTFYLVLALAVVSFLFITCLVVIISVKIYRWRQSRVLYHSNLPVIPYYPPRYSDTLGTGTLQHVYNYEVCRTTDSRKSDCKFGRAGSQNVLIMEPSSTGTMQRMQSEKSILDEPDSPLELIVASRLNSIEKKFHHDASTHAGLWNIAEKTLGRNNERTGAAVDLPSLPRLRNWAGQLHNTGGDDQGICNSCKLIVDVQDVNDNKPEINIMSKSTVISEDAKLNTVVTMINIEDKDSGENGKVQCFISENVPFTLKSTTNNFFTLVTDSELDRERASEYNITVTCSDEGVPSLSSSVTLTLQISDVNDNAPVFESSSYEAYIVENNTPGLSIFTVKARDADWNQNARVSYILEDSSVNGVPVSSYVSVSADSGVIHAVRSFDYEQIKDFQFRVKAQDGGSPPLSSNVTVKVLIQDQNDNPPQVLYPVQTGGSLVAEMVPRSADVGYLVTKVVAVDVDSGQNAWLSYKLQKATDRALFEVGSQNGEIRTIRQVTDKDAVKQRLTVIVEDNGQPSRSATVVVNVAVADSFPEVLSEFTDFTHDKEYNDNLTFYLVLALAVVSFLFITCLVVIISVKIYRWRQSRVLYHSNLPVIPYYPPRYSDTLGTGTLQQVYNYEVCRTTDSRKSDCKFGRAGSQNVLIMEPSSTGTMQRMQSEKSILDEPDSPLEVRQL
ncbi:putative protocadherin beta-16-like [Scophthalmus maximus]|uniref:Putative protocadherin beta-16-like n=1 Tax=Scophthalmus maximus TaxID=52904 RepID=A0A2U9C623_SCOMX|nr:putative protocadherin beta-16-like [Scophthalmus maximus]